MSECVGMYFLFNFLSPYHTRTLQWDAIVIRSPCSVDGALIFQPSLHTHTRRFLSELHLTLTTLHSKAKRRDDSNRCYRGHTGAQANRAVKIRNAKRKWQPSGVDTQHPQGVSPPSPLLNLARALRCCFCVYARLGCF